MLNCLFIDVEKDNWANGVLVVFWCLSALSQGIYQEIEILKY